MDLKEQLEANAITDREQVDPAKSSIESYILPTGLLDDSGVLHKEVIVRELTGNEEDILSSRKFSIFKRFQEVLEKCTISIGSVSQKDPNWSKYIYSLPVSDRVYLMLKIRQVSLGDNYAFKVGCPSCEKVSSHTVSLDSFKIDGMKNPEKRFWESSMPKSGKKYKAKIQTGVEEEKMSKFTAENIDFASLILLARLTEIDGKSPVTLQMVKELSMADRLAIRKDLGEHEGEIDRSIEIQCPHCGHEFSSDINIGSADFFFPSEM